MIEEKKTISIMSQPTLLTPSDMTEKFTLKIFQTIFLSSNPRQTETMYVNTLFASFQTQIFEYVQIKSPVKQIKTFDFIVNTYYT